MPGQPDAERVSANTELRHTQDLVKIFESWWSEFDGRQRRILAGRTFASAQLSLSMLGDELGLSRQRVQQLERAYVDHLESLVSGSRVKNWSAGMRARVNPVISLERMLNELPALREVIPSTDIPLWRVLAALDNSYEIREGWCAAPSAAAAQAATLGSFRAEVAEIGQVDLLTLKTRTYEMRGMAQEDVVEWVRACGLIELEGQVVSATASIPDRAAAILAAEGEPLSAQEIHARLGSVRSIRSLKNALGADERFSRVNRELWALEGWGLSPYKSIRGLIEGEVDSAGGQVEVTDLVVKLTTLFDVKPNSVVAYASAHPFILEEGVVRRMRVDELHRDARSPWETPRLYRRQRDWALRVRIIYDHVRGSGTVIPPALARLIGLRPGSAVTLDSEDGGQVFSWMGLAPTIGSVRRLLRNITEDDEVAFVFDDDRRFAIELLPTPSNSIEMVLAAAALRPQPPESSLSVLARAIGQPEHARVADIVAALRGRRDLELAELLEGL